MAIDVKTSVEINAPPKKVSAFVFDPLNEPQWAYSVERVELLTPPPVTLGSRIRRTGHVAGQRLEFTLEITRFEPENALNMKSVDSPFEIGVEYTLTTLDGEKTLVELLLRLDTWQNRATETFAKPLIYKNLEHSLARLKQTLEKEQKTA